MAVALVTVSTGNNTLVDAQEGKIIRVSRIIGGPSCDFTLKSNATEILPQLKVGASSYLSIDLPEGNVQTARGEALKASASGGPYTIWIVYDVVE